MILLRFLVSLLGVTVAWRLPLRGFCQQRGAAVKFRRSAIYCWWGSPVAQMMVHLRVSPLAGMSRDIIFSCSVYMGIALAVIRRGVSVYPVPLLGLFGTSLFLRAG